MATPIKKKFTSKQIAEITKGELVGSESLVIKGVQTLKNATNSDLSFLSNEKYISQVLSSRAPVVLVPENYPTIPPENRAWIKCRDPSQAFSLISSYVLPSLLLPPQGIHPTAVIAESASIGQSVHIGPHVVIGNDVQIGDHAMIESGSYLGHAVRVGKKCRIYPNVTILDRCKLGNEVTIHSGSVIGSDGFGYINQGGLHNKISQLGIVQIDDQVEIGANVSIDRARFDRTWIKKGAKIDNLVQIAHNVVIGENSIIISQVGISGSVDIGKNVILAGQVGIPGHVSIGDGAIIMAKSGLLGDAAPGAVLMGIPTVPRKQFWKQTAYLQKLPEMNKKIRELEREIKALKQSLSPHS